MGNFDLYRLAQYYDIAFDRDVRGEVDFIMEVCRKFAGTPPRSVLDIACGPGYHAREFARRGVRATGLDLRPEMLRLAREKAVAEFLTVDWIEADMRDFTLAQPVDAAMSLFDSHDALLTNADMVRHFQSVARNLTPQGIFVLATSHPYEVNFNSYPVWHFHGERDGVVVDLAYGTGNPRFDPLTEVAVVGIDLTVNDHGAIETFHDTSHERLVTPQEINLLADLSGAFEVCAWYGDYDPARPLDASPLSKEAIAVMKRR